jgi:hypothetical protein
VGGQRVEEVEERPQGSRTGARGELGVEVGEGECVVGAAGCGEAALDLNRECVLVGKEGGGEAAGEEPAREPQSVGLVATPAGVSGDEAMDELPDEILVLVVVHWCARRPVEAELGFQRLSTGFGNFCGCGANVTKPALARLQAGLRVGS